MQMDSDVSSLIKQIHDHPAQAVFYATGGGMQVRLAWHVLQKMPFDCFDSSTRFFQALTWLLTVPGASRTVLESRVPYAQSALQEALKFPTSSYASVGTAVDMAKAAYKQAAQLSDIGTSIIGIGCTCALMTDRVKKGDHKARSLYTSPKPIHISTHAVELSGRHWHLPLPEQAPLSFGFILLITL